MQIHHSRDLVHWRLLTRPLTRASQLDMRGDPDSCGVWAPCLTHADGLFHLIYTDVKRYGRTTVGGASGASLRDFHNYLVTSPRIDGDWSDPVYLNSSGFDPSLFHDDDGRKYLVNMLWDHRPGRNRFAGIVLQEYSPAERRLVGERRLIFEGTPLGLTEAPHLYKRDGYYYLLTAEGGTGWGHAVTMARSRTLTGPYELHPDVHVLSARHRPDAALQRAGHADLVETPAGETYMVYLCGRPLRNRGRCTLGRETAIAADAVGRRRLAAHGGRRRDSRQLEVAGAGLCPRMRSRRPRPRRLRRRHAADRLPVAAHAAIPEEIFSLTARPGPPAPLRTRDDRQPLPPGAGRAAPAGALLQRVDASWSSSPSTSSRWPGLVCYYGGSQVPLPPRLARRGAGQAPARDVGAPRLSRRPTRSRRRGRDPGRAAVELRVEVDYERLHFGYRLDGGALALAAAAVRRQHPLRRGDRAGPARTSPAPSSAWPARTWRARRCPPTSTGSSTASARFVADPRA